MIRFPCAHCGTKYELNEEFAGRHTRCRTCRQPLTVPGRVVPMAAPARIDGPGSSLHQLGVADGVTLSQTLAHVPAAPPPAADPGQRYLVAGELGRGGMGLVLRAVDRDIRREVAVKYLLDPNNPHKQARFVEEAQITGQLEHPNIAPVHDLGVDAQQRLFFTMKMVRGRSLAQVLDQLRKEPGSAGKDWSLGRLLTVLVNVCHALSYAHSRGVIHRDLKPANVMLGDFGEVYVMDWGLAKVLQVGAPVAAVVPLAATQDATLPALPLSPAQNSAERVVTSRTEEQSDLTQEGAVLGTPIYMPPEQAEGRIQAIDQRSDVYALGAILYEILTLCPPVAKEGGYLSILHRVINGTIERPERIKRGVPLELAAVAMKALAKQPAQRYPSVAAFLRDIVLYQEGRSVSAKEDTRWEQMVKFARRNKGFSGATAAALIVIALLLAVGFTANYRARVRAEDASLQAKTALGDLQREQEDKRKQARGSVPAFLEAARFSVERRKFDQALAQVNVALDYDPDHAAARLLRGQLLIVDQQYADAAAELNAYLKRWPEEGARQLLALCHKARRDDPATLIAFSDAFAQQKAFALSDGVLRSHGKSAPEAREKLLAQFRQRIKASWPGREDRLTLTRDEGFELDLTGWEQLEDLTPLRGLPLTTLNLEGCKRVRDLDPLQGLPLTRLILRSCPEVRDLLPLKNLPLTTLSLAFCPVTDLSPLREMPLTTLELVQTHVRDLSPLKGMKLTGLDLFACHGVTDLSPLAGMPLASLSLSNCFSITDLKPLVGMPLTALSLRACGQIRDLTPLKGMRLTALHLDGVLAAADLTPLKDMPLEELQLNGTPVRDLTPLKGMPLKKLFLRGCGEVQDLIAVQGMPLTLLDLDECRQVTDLTPLKGTKLLELNLRSCERVLDLSPLRGMPLQRLDLVACPQVRDLTPLEGIPLRTLLLPPKVTAGMEVLRKMPTLASINERSAAEFWKEYDAKKP